MRMIRVPYIYLTHSHVTSLHHQSHRMLYIICDIHHDIPNCFHDDPQSRHYQYHPSFLRWVHDKSVDEMLSRGIKHHTPLSDDVVNLKSLGLDYFLPPTDMEIAEDVVYLFEQWKRGRQPGGQKLPWSYLELARNVYGYTPNEAALEGVGEISGHHYHSDSGWYQVQSKT